MKNATMASTKQSAPSKRRKAASGLKRTSRQVITAKAGKAAQVGPIVGIGASAGGLAAFEAFFSGLPAGVEPQMAFVVVQHLAPDHKSLLAELVQRYTRMDVLEAEDGMRVAQNCVYIMPPNRDISLLNGQLVLEEPREPRGRRLPIDHFFESLAKDQGENAIGIVLSGTGSDGTRGVRAIKAAGGMIIAQDPASAHSEGMPRSAIGTGMVDLQLPPSEIAVHLLSYAANPAERARLRQHQEATRLAPSLARAFLVIRERTGHDFAQYKPSTIQRRIERRMVAQQIETLEDYLHHLDESPAEVDALFRDLLIGVTRFFRDPEAFEALASEILPKLIQTKKAGERLRIWCPGCASGEEAYTLAILLHESLEALALRCQVQIFASDLDVRALAVARAGIYPATIADHLTAERRARFFSPTPDGNYQVHKNLRAMVLFSEHDVAKDPPFSRLDLVSCRNLLIYMGSELQRKLMPLFHYALNPGGVLFLGTSESVGEFSTLFEPLDRRHKVFRRRELDGNRWAGPVPPGPVPTALASTRRSPVHPGPSYRDLAEQVLLQHVTASAALVDGRGNLLYLHGRTGQYFEPTPGECGTNNLLKMAREGLRRPLTLALSQAATAHAAVHYPEIRVKTNGDFTRVDVTVRPIETETRPLFLVILEATRPSVAHPSIHGPSGADLGAVGTDSPNMDERVTALRNELRSKEQYLQATNDELETSNEELKRSNEELQSVNEELQSTNEELETSKEEVQSINEELATVNSELQAKIADLSRANNDMNNLLAGTGIGTIFVDLELRILRFTPAVTNIIHLLSRDIGRPLEHIAPNLVSYDRLVDDARSVLDTLVPIDRQVQTRTGAWYTMRIRTYRTLDNVIEGVVLTFVDITDTKRAEQALHAAEERYRSANR